MCQNLEGKAKIGHLETAQKCAIAAKVPWEIIRDCWARCGRNRRRRCTTVAAKRSGHYRERDLVSGNADAGELALKIPLQGKLYGVHQRQGCVRARQYMEEVQGEPETFDG